MSDQAPIDPWEERLRTAGRSMVYPPTPDIAGSVREQLTAVGGHDRSGKQRLVWLAVLLVILGGSLLVPEVRAALRSFLQIGSVQIEVTTPTPGSLSSPATPTLPPTMLPAESLLNLSGETSLEEARSTLGFPLQLPAYPPELGPPDRVFLQGANRPREEQTLVLLWLDPADPERIAMSLHILGAEFWIRKQVTTVQYRETTVAGNEAVWINEAHVMFAQPGYLKNNRSSRIVTQNTLIWTANGLTYRLETDHELEEARRIAESIR